MLYNDRIKITDMALRGLKDARQLLKNIDNVTYEDLDPIINDLDKQVRSMKDARR